MKDWNAPENRLCTGHRASRPKIEIDCPKCAVTIDTETRMWIECPACGATFNRRTKVLLEEILAGDDK